MLKRTVQRRQPGSGKTMTEEKCLHAQMYGLWDVISLLEQQLYCSWIPESLLLEQVVSCCHYHDTMGSLFVVPKGIVVAVELRITTRTGNPCQIIK
jgi:hypothetical protein